MVKAYEDLTVKEILMITNGCGGKGGIVKPPHAKLFKPDCNRHDYKYFLGFRERDRIKADLELRRDMRIRIKNSSATSLRDHLYIDDSLILFDWLIRQIYYRWADLYYLGVAAVGKKFFYYGDKPQEL